MGEIYKALARANFLDPVADAISTHIQRKQYERQLAEAQQLFDQSKHAVQGGFQGQAKQPTQRVSNSGGLTFEDAADVYDPQNINYEKGVQTAKSAKADMLSKFMEFDQLSPAQKDAMMKAFDMEADSYMPAAKKEYQTTGRSTFEKNPFTGEVDFGSEVYKAPQEKNLKVEKAFGGEFHNTYDSDGQLTDRNFERTDYNTSGSSSKSSSKSGDGENVTDKFVSEIVGKIKGAHTERLLKQSGGDSEYDYDGSIAFINDYTDRLADYTGIKDITNSLYQAPEIKKLIEKPDSSTKEELSKTISKVLSDWTDKGVFSKDELSDQIKEYVKLYFTARHINDRKKK